MAKGCMYNMFDVLPLVIEEHLSSAANFFRNISRLKNVVCYYADTAFLFSRAQILS